ncbi:GDSL esterase/lipase At4g10955-like [Henckelia pumila]|uniref:GDSL esterase/lipase At4g10955-like n=1 Tax=Henckelia pumila TaxID=405737 RepID=UPI003C6E7B95
MASEREIFGHAGPYFLTAIDWNNSYHRRAIAASLVQGVYQLERDRHHNRHGPHALAPPWWEFFHFRLIQVLVDDHDVSYFGAIFEFMNKSPHDHDHPTPSSLIFQRPPAPLYVVAFRGTIKKAINRAQDFKLNLHCVLNNLDKSTRFQTGSEAVRGLASRVGSGNIWLAGHSLGASIALTIGREMARSGDGHGDHVETYLFNPPFMSPPIERIKNDKLRLGLRFANSVLTAGLAMAVNGRKKGGRDTDEFSILSSWVPYLFINPRDVICSEYVGYFEHREKMESIGAGRIGRIATQHSIGSVVSAARGKVSCGAVHLIPSAYLSVNCSPCASFSEAHGIHQWWRPDLEFQYKFYQYK